MDTLILSSDWRPVASVPWEKAMTIIFTDRAEILAEYDDRIISTPSEEYFMPSVIRFRNGKPPNIRDVKFSKTNVFARDKGRCRYCNKKLTMDSATYDHVVPRAQGGKTLWKNIVISCKKCNNKKGARTPKEANMMLLTRPYRPKNKTFKFMFHGNIPDEWKPFLGKAA